MATRLNAKTIRAAQAEVRAQFPNGGIIKGWFEEYDESDLNKPDKLVYESKVFKRLRSAFRRKTITNQKRTMPDYFTVEPLSNSETE